MVTETQLTVHYSAGDTGRACGTWGGMRTRDRAEVTCESCEGTLSQPAVTYDVSTQDGKIVEARVSGERLNELLAADGELLVRVHAEDHTRRPRRPGDPHTDARPVTGTRLFAGLNYSEMVCLADRLATSRTDLTYLQLGDHRTGEYPAGPVIAASDLEAVYGEISDVYDLLADVRHAVLGMRNPQRRAVAA